MLSFYKQIKSYILIWHIHLTNWTFKWVIVGKSTHFFPTHTFLNRHMIFFQRTLKSSEGSIETYQTGGRCFDGTHCLSVDGMHGEEQRSDQSQSGVFKHTAFARVHEQAGHSAVQAHVDHVEIERRGAVQQDVHPVKKRGGIFSI